MTHEQESICRTWWLLIAFSFAALVASAVSQVSLAADDQPATRPDDAPAVLTITGVVKDAFVGRPISGAKVTVFQEIGKGEAQKSVKRFELITDADGRYKFAWRTDDPQNPPDTMQGYDSPVFSFNVVARRIDYLTASSWSNVPVQLRMTFNQTSGFAGRTQSDDPAQRWLSALELRPGKSVTGIVHGPDGKPLAGVKVVAHSRAPDVRDIRIRGDVTISPEPPVSDEDQTDQQGRFQVTMITPGVGMLSIEPGKDYAPAKQVVYEQRGDFGVIELQRGAVIHGKLVDVDGKPHSPVQVTAYPWNLAERKISDPHSGQNIDEEIHAAAMTDADGSFNLARLPAGEYRVEPVAYSDPKQKVNENGQFYNEFHPVPGVFVPQKIKVANGQEPPAIEFRGLPTVRIQGSISAMSTTVRGATTVRRFGGGLGGPTVLGTFGGMPYRATISPGDDSTFTMTVPKGMIDTVIELPSIPGRGGTATQIQWRLGDGPLQSTPKIRLGTLEKDFTDLEVVLVLQPPNQQLQGAPLGAVFGQPAQPAAAAGRGGRAGRPARGGAAPPVQQPVEQPAEEKEEDAGK